MNKSSCTILFLLLSLTSFAFGSQDQPPIQVELIDQMREQQPTFELVAIRLMEDPKRKDAYIIPDTESYPLFFEQVQETFPQAEVIIAGGKDLKQGNNFAWWKEQDPLPTCSVILRLKRNSLRKRSYLWGPTPAKLTDKPTQPSRPLLSTTSICALAAATTATAALGWYLKTKFKSLNQEK